ncbi:MAG: hypothetical protein WBN59_08500 [Flavobacteriaceae bacterium]
MWVIRNNSAVLILGVYLLMGVFACTPANNSDQASEVFFGLNHLKKNFVAGETIKLLFETPALSEMGLQIDNGYGTYFLTPEMTDAGISFTLPAPLSTISGHCSWQLIHKGNVRLQGQFYIHPETESKINMESYLGPRNIIAGTDQGSMLVSIPSDVYDNPLGQGTVLHFNERYRGQNQNFRDTVQYLVSWRYIDKKEIAGRIFIRSSIGRHPSGEMYADIKPAVAEDFSIALFRNHEYADGNQQMILRTAQIKDRFNNVINDGTLVTFGIETGLGELLFTNATTVNGIAEAKIIHPAAEASWNISAFITGEASSNTLQVSFEASVKDYDISFSTDGQQLIIGPIIGFMGQLVPDFTDVSITITYEDGRKELKTVWTGNGFANLDLGGLRGQTSAFRIETLGVLKTLTR